MLRELIDTAWLEDFVSGLSRAAGLRVCVYDPRGALLAASMSNSDFAKLTGYVLGALPGGLTLTPVPAHDPPGHVAYVDGQGVWYIAAPVHVDEADAGWVAVGEFREQSLSGEQWRQAAAAANADIPAVVAAWETLPLLDRSGASRPVVSVRWAARLLAEWGRREARLAGATEQVALVGDIAALLTGDEDLQRVLDGIVSGVARVMQCPFASIRLYDPRTGELNIKAVHNLSPQYVGKGVIHRTPGGYDDLALRGQIVHVDDVPADARTQFPEQAAREGIKSMLTAGMIYRGNPVGVLRVYTKRLQRFRKAQRDLLRAVAYQAATAIVHAQLVDERLRSAQMRRQLELAGDLQRRMVRTAPLDDPRIETAIVFQPSHQVGGDFCDVFRLRDGRVALVVGDVAGKGVPASLLMSSVRGALRAAADWSADLAELITRLNRQVCRETLPREFVTLLLAAVDPARGELAYCNAGHEPAMIASGQHVRCTTEGDMVLGIDPQAAYSEHRIGVKRGDLVLLYTDGAIEARDFEDHQFGRERLEASLLAARELPVQQVLESVLWDVRRYVGLAEQLDDLTLVGLRLLS